MRARAFASALFLFSLLLAGCKEAILAEPPPTVAPVSIPESSLGFDPLMATLVGFSPKTLLLASPDPVYYGSGCVPSEPTQLNVKFTETSELVTSLPGMSKGSMTSVAYQFHSPTTLPSAGGETKYIVSLLGLGSPHIFSIDLSAQSFDGTDGWIDLWVETELMTIGSGPGGGLSISTTKLFESKPLRIKALTCKGATPTATITPTPGFDYSGELHVIPDIVYAGACPVGLPSLDLFGFFRPAKAPDVAKPPVPVKYYAQLDFIAPSGIFYPSVMNLMTWSGAPDNQWYFSLPLLLASWPPAYEDGLISVTVFVMADDSSLGTVYRSGTVQIPFKACVGATATATSTLTPIPTSKPAATNKPPKVNEPPPPTDNDQDGYPAGPDCDDGNPNVNPGVPESPNTPYDDNCNGDLLT